MRETIAITVGEKRYRASLGTREIWGLQSLMAEISDFPARPSMLQVIKQGQAYCKLILAGLKKYHPEVTHDELEQIDFAALDQITVEITVMIKTLAQKEKQHLSERLLRGRTRGFT